MSKTADRMPMVDAARVLARQDVYASTGAREAVKTAVATIRAVGRLVADLEARYVAALTVMGNVEDDPIEYRHYSGMVSGYLGALHNARVFFDLPEVDYLSPAWLAEHGFDAGPG